MSDSYDQKIQEQLLSCQKSKNVDNYESAIKQAIQKMDEKNQLIYDKEFIMHKKGKSMNGDVLRKVKLSNEDGVLFTQMDGEKRTKYGFPKACKEMKDQKSNNKELQQCVTMLNLDYDDRKQPVQLYFNSQNDFNDFQNFQVQKKFDATKQTQFKNFLKQSQQLQDSQRITQFQKNMAQWGQIQKQKQVTVEPKQVEHQVIAPVVDVTPVVDNHDQEEKDKQAELLRQYESNRLKQIEIEKQKQIDADKQKQIDADKQKQIDADKQKQIDDEKQKQIDADKLKDAERIKSIQREEALRKQREIDLQAQKDRIEKEKQLELLQKQKDSFLKKQLKQSNITQTINFYLEDLEISENTPIHQPALQVYMKKQSEYDDTPRIVNGQSIVDQVFFQQRFELKLSGENREQYNFWQIQDTVKEFNVKNFKLDDYIIFEIEDQIQLNDSPVTISTLYHFNQIYDSFHHGKMHFLIFDFHKSQIKPTFIEFQTFQTPSLTNDIKNITELYDHCFELGVPVYDPIYSEKFQDIDKDLLSFLKEFFQQKDTYRIYQQIQQKRYYKDIIVLIHNYYVKQICRSHFQSYINLDKIEEIEEQLQEQKDYFMTQEFGQEMDQIQKFEQQYKDVFTVENYRNTKQLQSMQNHIVQAQWFYADDNIDTNVNLLCKNGIPSDFRLIFYNCIGQLYQIQNQIIDQIKTTEQIDVTNDQLYFYLKSNTIQNTLLQSVMKEQFDKIFKGEDHKTYKQTIIYDVLKVIVFMSQNFKINQTQILYSRYVISIVEKLSYLVHNMYGCEEDEEKQLAFYESIIFWGAIVIILNLNSRYQLHDSQQETNFQLNKIIVEDVMFLRSQIQVYFKDMYQVMLDLGISVELLFGESVLNFGSDWLNVEMFYRVIDLAFSQIKETNNFISIALILALLDKFQQFLIKAKSFCQFKDILKFCCKYLFDGDYLVQSIISYQEKINTQNYQDFQSYIFEKNNYYKIYDKQMQMVQEMIVDSQPDGLNLCDIINIIGKHATRQEISPNEDDDNQIDLEQSCAINYDQVYIKVWEEFNLKLKKGIHLYIHKIVLFWPYNTTFMLEVLQDDQTLLQIKIESESEQNMQIYKYFPYVENQNIFFKLYQIGFDNQENTLIKNGSLKVQSFYTNTIYQHEVSLNNYQLQQNENFYDSFLNISCMIESQTDNRINNQLFTKNQNLGPNQYCNKILNIGDLDPSIFDQNRFVEELLQNLLQNNLNQFNISSIYLPNNYWKFDSIMNEKNLEEIIKKSNLFPRFTDFSNLFKLFSNNQKFYFKDFLVCLILNCKGTFKQKINQIYSQFQCFELCHEQKNTINIETVKNFIYYLYDILQIPNKKNEIENWIDCSLYKVNNHIIKAQLNKMDKKLDLTSIFQKSSQYNYLNYGTFDVIFGSQDQLLFLERSLKFYFHQNDINMIFEHDGSANLRIIYMQSGVLKNEEFTINQNYQILKTTPIIQTHDNQSSLEQIFQINENILNLQNYENSITFKQFYDIFFDMPFLYDVIMQKEFNYAQQKDYIHAQFSIKFQGKTVIKIDYQNKNKEYRYHDQAEYQENIKKLQTQQIQQTRPINENSYYQIDYLDIFEHMETTIHRINNYFIKKQLKTGFNDQIKNIDFDKYELKLSKDITPDGSKILSLNDLFSLTSKFYKKIRFTINFQKKENLPQIEKVSNCQRSLFRVAADNNKWMNCQILYYHPRNKKASNKTIFEKQFPDVKFFAVKFLNQDDTIYLKKPIEVEFNSEFNLNSIPSKPLCDQYR